MLAEKDMLYSLQLVEMYFLEPPSGAADPSNFARAEIELSCFIYTSTIVDLPGTL